MMKLKKKWKILIFNHAHTDIGYTDRQEKIEWHHIEYIREVINILKEAYENGREEWKGFRWTCESYWCVEKFLEEATEDEKRDFVKYVNEGNIGLSFNYLNLSDVVDEDVLREISKRTLRQLQELGLKAECGMTADINGYSWGYPEILSESNVKFLYSCTHPHHGLFPLGRKQFPFKWKTPNGGSVLVWNGENYTFGNELGLSQFASREYMLKDGLDSKGLDFYDKAVKRIFNYLHQLNKEDYPFDFIPVTVSALMTDNAPPSFRIAEFINRWNKEYGDEIELKMATLEELYENTLRYEDVIPTYSGDWTDWWADGTGSTPAAVKQYREGIRLYNLCKKLDSENILGSKELMDKALYYFMMYSEHTWGHSASITEPWSNTVNNLDLRKQAMASNGHEAAARNLDKITAKLGETELKMWRDIKFKVVNPHDEPKTEIAKFNLEILFGHERFNIVDEATGEVYPHQVAHVARGFEINVLVNLKAKETKTLVFKDIQDEEIISLGGYAASGSDGVYDLVNENHPIIASTKRLETPFYKIEYKIGDGITSIVSKKNNVDLLRKDRIANPFTPIYEVTDIKFDMYKDRTLMGRNRKATNSRRYFGKLVDINVLDKGDVFGRVELIYEVKGCSYYSVILTAYRDIERIDVACRIGKDNVWNPENVYLPLPFTLDNKEEIYIDKAGCYLRPRVDQLPMTCVDFYAIQNGVVLKNKDTSLVIASKDAHLIYMGDIEHHEIKLCGEDGVNNNDLVYSWVMNNYWETNFKATLGGFYEFNYSIFNAKGNIEKVFKQAKESNEGIVCFNRWQ